MHPVQVSFYHIKDNQSKINLICTKAKESILLEKKLLILVGTQEAGQYIDSLLWRLPEESFIPHLFTQNITDEWIAITMQSNNINQAPIVLNLQLSPISFFHEFEEIIEFYDETSSDKTLSSQTKIKFYKSKNINISYRK
jgi:DNA polymerase-3 subunit chi